MELFWHRVLTAEKIDVYFKLNNNSKYIRFLPRY